MGETGLEEQLRDARSSTGTVDVQHALARARGELLGDERPVALDRYRLDDRIGQGGAGLVYRGFDPALGRPVAVKFMKSQRSSSVRASERMLREARALAKLSHPNVVGVYDTGSYDDGIYLVMELLEGPTLQTWLEQRRRSFSAIRKVLLAAGRGLAAVHALGLVHRDFKPSNVMFGRDRRVRVLDFGLAAADGSASDAELQEASTLPDIDAQWNSKLTASGVVVGTPQYMAPEQHAGASVDSRADQYAFCLVAFEAFFGERPFSGASVRELAYRKKQGTISAPESATSTPAGLMEILRRGLSADPNERYPDMPALLGELRRVGAPRRRVAMVLGAATVVSAGIIGVASSGAQPTACEPTIDHTASPQRFTEIEAAFAATNSKHASTGWAAARANIDEWIAEFRQSYEEACRAGEVRDSSARVQCLQQREVELDALLALFEQADPATVATASAAAQALPKVDECTDAQHAEGQSSIERMARRRIAEANVRNDAGLYRDGVSPALAAVSLAQATGNPRLDAEANHVAGLLKAAIGEHDAAEAHLERTFHRADEIKDDRLAARAALALVKVIGVGDSRRREAEEWARHARARTERLGNPPSLLSHIITQEAHLNVQFGSVEEAVRGHREALRLRTEHFGPSNRNVGSSHMYLGTVLSDVGDLPGAERELRLALQVWTESLGPAHPDLALVHGNLGRLLRDAGRFEEALAEYRRALTVWESSTGQSATVVDMLCNIGSVLADLGRFDERREVYTRAEALANELYDDDDPNWHIVLQGLATTAFTDKDYEAARGYYVRGLALSEATRGPEHLTVGIAELQLGQLDLELGHLDSASRRIDRAVAILEGALGADNPLVARALLRRGALEVAREEHGEAVKTLRRVVRLLHDSGAEPLEEAEAGFMLARALVDEGSDREGAFAAACDSDAIFDKGSLTYAKMHSDLKSWLAKQFPKRACPQ